jgi:hypothetical protein
MGAPHLSVSFPELLTRHESNPDHSQRSQPIRMTGIFVLILVLMCGQRATTLEGGIEEGSLDFSVCSPFHCPLLLGHIHVTFDSVK